ncbi:MAG: hypothetical protein U9Q82_01115 [Chloroflexota bacterium]|nr:hypothetical protein [Chloroflexota bacterium]
MFKPLKVQLLTCFKLLWLQAAVAVAGLMTEAPTHGQETGLSRLGMLHETGLSIYKLTFGQFQEAATLAAKTIMERTVPYTASEEVELYLRTYYSLLRSTSDVQIKTLEQIHSGMNSLLHTGARNEAPDMSAFIYSVLRLPACIQWVQTVALGQSIAVFEREGVGDIEQWDEVAARARRRRCYFDGDDTLACIIASRSDIDDVVPLLTAYQIEWKKLHLLLRQLPKSFPLHESGSDSQVRETLAAALQMSVDDMERLYTIWGDDFVPSLERIKQVSCRLRILLLSGTLTEYHRATHAWWENIEHACPALLERPVYFVSGNMHSLVNLLSGFALKHRSRLVKFLENSDDEDLLREWVEIQARMVPSSQENFLYYILKKYLQSNEGQAFRQTRRDHELVCGIQRVDSEHFFDVDVQIIDLSKIKPEWMDPRICDGGGDWLARSDAMILNIDYPLGLAAYNILSEVAVHAGKVLGVYSMGKAATLNGVVGDVMIPGVVHDEHSRNTFIFPNAIAAADVAPHLVYGTVLDNQKSVTVRGTFLQNADYMDVFYSEGYTDIEMEAGPYLSAVYEMFRPKRHPVDEIVNLYNLPFDLGIMHYASDTPLSKGKNLGASTLSYFGMDPTYAAAIAILRRILQLEQERVSVAPGK